MLCLFPGFANDLTFDKKNASSKPEPGLIHGEQNFPDDNSVGSPVNANGKQENSTNGDYTVQDESYAHSEDDLGRSPHDSPAGKSTVESPSQEFSNAHFRKSFEADAETHRYLFSLSLSLARLLQDDEMGLGG